jgi:hypothetical protein
MHNRGKLVIIFMLGVAVCAAAFAAWYQYRGQDRAHDFWGTVSAVLIADAPQVEVLLLGESEPGGEIEAEAEGAQSSEEDPDAPKMLEFGDRVWKVLSTKDGSAAQGIQNIRKALVQNTTFDWGSQAGADEPEWQYALAFTDRKNWATVLFDFETNRVALTGGRMTAVLDPAASKDLRGFFAEQFHDRPAGESPAEPAVESPPVQATDAPAEKPAEEPRDKPSETPREKE